MFGNELLDAIANSEGSGLEIAQKIQKDFGGMAIYISKGKPFDETQKIIEQNFGTLDTRQLARLTGLSVRAIQNRLNRPISKRQETLF